MPSSDHLDFSKHFGVCWLRSASASRFSRVGFPATGRSFRGSCEPAGLSEVSQSAKDARDKCDFSKMSAVDEILSYKKKEEEDYYAILGVDEHSSVSAPK